MKWHNSIQFKFAVFVLIAIMFIPIVMPLTSMVTYIPGVFIEYENTPYEGFNELTEMWHSEARNLEGKEDSKIKKRLQELNDKYPKSEIFWVDHTGRTRDTFSYSGTLPGKWSVPYTIQFMKDSFDADPYTVVAFLGKKKDSGFMVIKVDRILLEPPVQRLSEGYNYAFIIVFLAFMLLFALLSYLFIRSIRKRLLRLKEAMEAKKGSGIPLAIKISKMDEIGQIEESFNSMVQALEGSRLREIQEEKLRRELIANLSHDIRTPLTTIRGHLNSINQEIDTAKGKAALETIDHKIDFLSGLIDNLFSYTLLSAGKYPCHLNRVEMNRFIREAAAGWYPILEEHEIEVELQMQQQPAFWTVDPNWIERIIDNLLQNVVRHAREGKFVEISLTDNQLIFKDKGRGFSQESKQKGAGIGMVIIDLMVREMGLEWEIESTGTGTTIYIRKLDASGSCL
ncbi:HAMP domain-containing sensor histidine kinase [Peribacillus glennii]|uniref:histidine kinase n=1 Tax=Peribacillus glennii TaxID=2303991 RepID=A0A372LAM5_9BACI|nr:HAMP domain-containing sensor histidine kinase [Peribacillus glennii]RFU62819.1 sensor histidine kinase [Peribacillus glennii]